MLISDFADLGVILQYKLVRRKLKALGSATALQRLEKVRLFRFCFSSHLQRLEKLRLS